MDSDAMEIAADVAKGPKETVGSVMIVDSAPTVSDEGSEVSIAPLEGESQKRKETSSEQTLDAKKPKPTYKKYTMNIEKFLELLAPIEKAGQKIKDKEIWLLIGLTGAGKTTTILKLCGILFELIEDEYGRDHFEPKALPQALKEFVVGGGSVSVTQSIHAVDVTLPCGKVITVVDTPGFGDTKGVEMELANGAGIINALHQSKSVKPFLVMNAGTMHERRFQAFSDLLDIVMKMMGPGVNDFSAFGYLFTNCETRKKRSLYKMAAAFLRHNTATVEPQKRLFMQDMVEKTKGGAIVVDPSDDEDRNELLNEMEATGGMITTPNKRFVNFASENSRKALEELAREMAARQKQALEERDISCASGTLADLENLANALPLEEFTNSLGERANEIHEWVSHLLSDVSTLATKMTTCRLDDDLDDYKLSVGRLRSLILVILQVQKSELYAQYEILASAGGTVKTFDDVLCQCTTLLFQNNANLDHTSDAQSLKVSMSRHICICRELITGEIKLHFKADALRQETDRLMRLISGIVAKKFVSVQSQMQSMEDEADVSALGVAKEALLFLVAIKDFFDSPKGSVLRDLQGNDVDVWSDVKFQELMRDVSDTSNKVLDGLIASSKEMNTFLQDLETFPDLGRELLRSRSFVLSITSDPVLACFLAAKGDETQAPAVIVDRLDTSLRDFVLRVGDYIHSRAGELSGESGADDYHRQAETVFEEALSEADKLLDLSSKIITVCVDLEVLDNENRFDDVRMKLSASDVLLQGAKESISSARNKKEPEPSCAQPASWVKKFNEVKAYKKRHGRFPPRKIGGKNNPLGKWIDNQRCALKRWDLGLPKNTNSIADDQAEERYELFDSIGAITWKK